MRPRITASPARAPTTAPAIVPFEVPLGCVDETVESVGVAVLEEVLSADEDNTPDGVDVESVSRDFDTAATHPNDASSSEKPSMGCA